MKLANVEDIYPLSPLQEGLLFHAVSSPESRVYFEQLVCNLSGDLDVSSLRRAWQKVVDRHPILRTAFFWEDLDKPLQVVHRKVELPWTYLDWRELSPDQKREKLAAYLRHDQSLGFEISEAPLMRIGLIRMLEDSYELVWSRHHLLLDGWSQSRVLKESFTLYDALRQGLHFDLALPRPYRDYIAWIQHQDLLEAKTFWKQQLEGFTAPTPLPIGRIGRGLEASEKPYDQRELRLTRNITDALQRLGRRHQLTLNTIIQGAWALLLTRYANVADVVFGSVVSGRPSDLPGVESMVGLFINTLPLRVQVAGEDRLIPWLKKLQELHAEVRQYEYSPLASVQSWTEVPSGAPLFESILIFENYPLDNLALETDSIVSYSGEDRSGEFSLKAKQLLVRDIRSDLKTHYPLTVAALPEPELLLAVGYDRQRFDGETIGRILRQIAFLLEETASNHDRGLSDLSLLPSGERRLIVNEWNDTIRSYPTDLCLHQMFESQVEKSPNAIALMCNRTELSYAELNSRSNCLAHYLRQIGIGPEVMAGLFISRGSDMVVGILGILKAGGAYVPLDPSYPTERLAWILRDAGVSVVLTEGFLVDRLPENTARIVCLDVQGDLLREYSAVNPSGIVRSSNVAYAIYTSGSTGKPKGVLVEHKSAANLVWWAKRSFSSEELARVLFSTSICFDLSVFELFAPLSSGGTAILVENLLQSVSYFSTTGVTLLNSVPSVAAELVRAGWTSDSAVVVCLAGEALTSDLVAELYQHSNVKRVLNLYGPTETTTYSTAISLGGDLSDAPTIGRPIANTEIYILDGRLNPLPIGVTGELYIGGAGVARGYLNNPKLTAERFLPNHLGPSAGGRLYRTGDLARYLPDGSIEFRGRIDHQIKMRGFRIEPGEIESTLLQHPVVRKAIVVARRDDSGQKQLVGYFVPETGKTVNIQEVRDFLKQKLPQHMVPSMFVSLDAFPLTSSGKVDREALPPSATTHPQLGSFSFIPETALEQTIARVWEEVLQWGKVGVDDNFFDLGGNSILVTRVVGKLRGLLDLDLPTTAMFEFPTIRSFARYLADKPDDSPPLFRSRARAETRKTLRSLNAYLKATRTPGESE